MVDSPGGSRAVMVWPQLTRLSDPARNNDMQIDIIDDLERLKALEQDWIAVYEADPEAPFFVSWTWMSHWLETAIKQWIVLAVRSSTDASRHVAFFALRPATRFKKGGRSL